MLVYLLNVAAHRFTLKYTRNLTVTALIALAIFHWPYVRAILRKSTGQSEPCPWGKLLKVPLSAVNFEFLKTAYALRIKLAESDARLGIQRFTSPTRPFWIKACGQLMDGKELLAYVLAEEDWIMKSASSHAIRRGDVVVDIGAHIGTFGDDALRRGAGKVVMIEPDPTNVECIRRNFSTEIRDGRVIVVPEGAWSCRSTLDFHIGVANSGMGSFESQEAGARKIQVPVRPLDEILPELGIPKVDFIKIDIEGAEREALKGAQNTLRASRPRIMLDAYHRPDDFVVLPSLIRLANSRYGEFCPVCSVSASRAVIPYAVFFE